MTELITLSMDGKLAHFETKKTVVAEPVTPANFEKYGGVISSDHQLATVKSSSANYGTATKLFQVSPVECLHDDARANLNLFRCSPPLHLIEDHRAEDNGLSYPCRVLERHPFSTQTFLPMGRPKRDISYMVIVAPSDPSSPQKLPLVEKTEAFVVRGDQAVTYGAGTWHAPMISLGDVTDFAVLIHETGDASRDTEEVSIDTVTVEFTMGGEEEEGTKPRRKGQSSEEYEEQKQQYAAEGPPSGVLGSSVGDKSFDLKQIKYAVEREYYARNYKKVIELVDANPLGDPKRQAELDKLKERAVSKLAT